MRPRNDARFLETPHRGRSRNFAGDKIDEKNNVDEKRGSRSWTQTFLRSLAQASTRLFPIKRTSEKP